MLRLTVSTEEYLMIGEDIKLVFLGGTGKHLRIMVDAPKEKNIVRSSVLERGITDPEERAKLPRYHAEPEHPEKYVKKKASASDSAKAQKSDTAQKSAAAPQEGAEQEGPGNRRRPRVIIARGNAR